LTQKKQLITNVYAAVSQSNMMFSSSIMQLVYVDDVCHGHKYTAVKNFIKHAIHIPATTAQNDTGDAAEAAVDDDNVM